MAELIQRYENRFEDETGMSYEVSVYGAAREDGTWEGWLVFHPAVSGGAVRRTERETSQPNREALAYWASGLEPLYLEGAFARTR